MTNKACLCVICLMGLSRDPCCRKDSDTPAPFVARGSITTVFNKRGWSRHSMTLANQETSQSFISRGIGFTYAVGLSRE